MTAYGRERLQDSSSRHIKRRQLKDGLGRALGPTEERVYGIICEGGLAGANPKDIEFGLNGDSFCRGSKLWFDQTLEKIKDKLGEAAIIRNPDGSYTSRRVLIELIYGRKKKG